MSIELLVISIFILAGSIFQVATGVGLGLIAGPVLLYFADSHSALQIALILNLALTLILLPFDFHMQSRKHSVRLSLWSLVGFPVGFSLFLLLDQAILKIFAASVILLAVIQLRFFPNGATTMSSSQLSTKSIETRENRMLGVGGSVAGAMTSALSVPGPMALWTLLSVQLDPLRIRGTLRVYYAVAFSLALALHVFWSGVAQLSYSWSLKLMPMVLTGIAIGLLVRRFFRREHMQIIFELLLLVMGVALLCKGVIEVI